MSTKKILAWTLPFLSATIVSSGSLTDIKHVVLFMQENRAFDHYYGTMAGVRGFADPNVQVNPNGKNTYQQVVTANMSKKAEHLTPWHLNYLGGEWVNATQCMVAGSNGWVNTHEAYNGGLNNQWATWNSPWSWGYFKRNDIPTHFDVADGWTVLDMYQEGVLAATDPNRITWVSGTVNNPGTPSNPDGDGGMMLDNSVTPGCEKPHLNCYPLKWKTNAEYWQDAGVTWQVYQNRDNFEDNMLAYFKQYQDVSHDTDNPLTKHGNSYIGLEQFYKDAKKGTLPMVSYVVGPAELAEHPPFMPSDGAWLVKKVVDAVTTGASYKDTALIFSYDEPGGFGDHVTPFHASKGTPGEWIHDPYDILGEVPVGPGFRVPSVIISPWTRGGHVFGENADHNSQTMFVEEWLEAHGYKDVRTENITPWRRKHMSNLLKAFDFDHPDFSLPTVASAPSPVRNWNKPKVSDGLLGDLYGNYVGSAKCVSTYNKTQPPPPYGPENENADMSKQTEEGFKQVRGDLTEGRYLTFEMNGMALAGHNNQLTAAKASASHDSVQQRWVVHQKGVGDSKTYFISSAANGRYIGTGKDLADSEKTAVSFKITDKTNGKGYVIQNEGGKSIRLSSSGAIQYEELEQSTGFSIFSVTYHS